MSATSIAWALRGAFLIRRALLVALIPESVDEKKGLVILSLVIAYG
jgi:hypothetical protein